MEVYKVENITYLYISQVDGKRVGLVFRGDSIYDYMLPTMLNREVVYKQEFVAIENV